MGVSITFDIEQLAKQIQSKVTELNWLIDTANQKRLTVKLDILNVGTADVPHQVLLNCHVFYELTNANNT